MSAIRIAIAGILVTLVTFMPGTTQAGMNNVVIMPLADYTSMDNLSSARHQSQSTSAALTAPLAAKGMTVIAPEDVFTSLKNRNCIAPLTFNSDLRPAATTLELENEIDDDLTNRMQNELKSLINTEQKRMTPGLADTDNHLTPPATATLDTEQIVAIASELGADYVLRGRVLATTISDERSLQRHLPTTPLRRSILPFFATINQDEQYAVAAAKTYDKLDDIMLAGLFGSQDDQRQVVRMQLWVHDATTGQPLWSNITTVPFGSFPATNSAESAIRKASKILINDFYAQIAVDDDGDGVHNHRDQCPDTKTGVTVNRNGCPSDQDGDGVADYMDRCPDTPAGIEVDAAGCPKDADKDGVFDQNDRCPDTPTDLLVDENGCPEDSDGDSVPDYIDKCANTPAGIEVNSDGCPKPIREKVSMNLHVEFDFDKAEIKPVFHEHLRKVADFLNTYQNTTAEIEGHTDKEGTAEYNQKLSQRRAEAVRQYLIDQFNIAPERLTAHGYGESRPVDGDPTKTRNPKNRRAVAVFSTTVEH